MKLSTGPSEDNGGGSLKRWQRVIIRRGSFQSVLHLDPQMIQGGDFIEKKYHQGSRIQQNSQVKMINSLVGGGGVGVYTTHCLTRDPCSGVPTKITQAPLSKVFPTPANLVNLQIKGKTHPLSIMILLGELGFLYFSTSHIRQPKSKITTFHSFLIQLTCSKNSSGNPTN